MILFFVSDSDLPYTDPQFIGAWWMGFLIFGCIIIAISIPLMRFPKHMPFYTKSKYERWVNLLLTTCT